MLNDIATFASVLKTKMRLNIINEYHVNNFKMYWKHFTHVAKFILNYEENIMIYTNSLEDKKTISEQIIRLTDTVMRLSIHSPYILDVIRIEFDKCQKTFINYMVYIEQVMLDINNTKVELEVQLINTLKPIDFGWLLRSLKTKKEKRKWLSRTANIPRIIQTFVVFPALKKYNKQYLSRFDNLIQC
jgi:hypothetical protein